MFLKREIKKNILSESATDCIYLILKFKHPFKIAFDSSDIAVAGFLSQQGDEDVGFPLLFSALNLMAPKRLWQLFIK